MAEVKEFDVTVIPYLLKIHQPHYWVDYDEDADTLYIRFREPQCANDSIMENDLIYYYAGGQLVGSTIFECQKCLWLRN